MTAEIQKKMDTLMYQLTKLAAMSSFSEFLDDLGITQEEYRQIKAEWKEKLNVTPYL